MDRDEFILELDNICKSYPGVTALDGVSISFKKGEVHALVGENGAGKSTLMKSISGSISPDQGTIKYEGIKYQAMHPKEAINLGISTIYQEFSLVSYLTVAENIYLGNRNKAFGMFDRKKINRKAQRLIEDMGLSLDEKERIINLTPAHQQMVEILRAISRDVKVLIMDEPSAALSSAETEVMFRVINDLKEKGITIIYISHRMEEIFRLSDRVSVLRDGKYIVTLQTDKTTEKELIKRMVGREVPEVVRSNLKKSNIKTLEVRKLTTQGKLADVSFCAFKGEILGFGGLVGAGRTEMMRCLFGADPYDSGQILIDGQKVNINSPAEAIRKGIVLIPEDRKQQGLVLNMSVGDNISMVVNKKLSQAMVIRRAKKKALEAEQITSLKIKTPSSMQKVKYLSGGNQQKVVLAKMLSADSKVIIFDEPTRGIDVGAKYEIYEIMKLLARQGKTVLMVSSDMMELLSISDRIIVMREGKIAGELEADDFAQEKILTIASGMVKQEGAE